MGDDRSIVREEKAKPRREKASGRGGVDEARDAA
jgi:hypothetical protein